MSNSKLNLLVLVSLWLLTGISFVMGEWQSPAGFSLLIVGLLISLKGQHIVDIYMDMRLSPVKWRALMLSYIVILPAILMAIYLW